MGQKKLLGEIKLLQNNCTYMWFSKPMIVIEHIKLYRVYRTGQTRQEPHVRIWLIVSTGELKPIDIWSGSGASSRNSLVLEGKLSSENNHEDFLFFCALSALDCVSLWITWKSVSRYQRLGPF